MQATAIKEDLRQVDRQLLDLLRDGGSMGIAEFVDRLGVTATAVRQRVDRMLELGLLDRTKNAGSRGRPTYNYSLTALGRRAAAADPGELVEAMWESILAVPDEQTRRWLLRDVARRLGTAYREKLPSGPLSSKLQSMKELLGQKRILAEVSAAQPLPVLDIHACPYPDLTDEDSRRDMCQLEEEMLSEALGQPMQLSRCQLDGHDCCQFAPAEPDSQTPPIRPTVDS